MKTVLMVLALALITTVVFAQQIPQGMSPQQYGTYLNGLAQKKWFDATQEIRKNVPPGIQQYNAIKELNKDYYDTLKQHGYSYFGVPQPQQIPGLNSNTPGMDKNSPLGKFLEKYGAK